MDAGASEYANCRLVMENNISATVMTTYCGSCQRMWTVVGGTSSTSPTVLILSRKMT